MGFGSTVHVSIGFFMRACLPLPFVLFFRIRLVVRFSLVSSHFSRYFRFVHVEKLKVLFTFSSYHLGRLIVFNVCALTKFNLHRSRVMHVSGVAIRPGDETNGKRWITASHQHHEALQLFSSESR